MGELIGPGQTCVFCGEGYGLHLPLCPQTGRSQQPRRFRFPCPENRHPNGLPALYRYGAYFPMTDLVVWDMGGRGTGEPTDVEWID